MGGAELYVGLDLSTQSLKCTVLDSNLTVLHQESVTYATDLPHYRTTDGFHTTGTTVTSPVCMWVEALDIILARLSQCNIELANVVGIGGCGQQHGTVYCKHGFEHALRNADPALPLLPQLADHFSVSNSPIWMDNSTTQYCTELEARFGGAGELCRRTGSAAYPRFSVHQIQKLVCEDIETYHATERVLLVSNFLATLLSGHYREIDYSDASGMNLLDIATKTWIREIGGMYGDVNVCDKLGTPSPFTSVPVSNYLASRYKLRREQCTVSSSTGDNPATLLGMFLSNNDIILSLGSSDVLIGTGDAVVPSPDKHVFCSPLNSDEHMFIMCYKNAALVRAELRDKYSGGSWAAFNETLTNTDINTELVGGYYPHPEIIPQGLEGAFTNTSTALFDHTPGTVIRTVLEGQFLSKRNHIDKTGVRLTAASKLVVVGGGSVNSALLQLVCDVFNVPVYRSDSADIAALGAAYLGYLTRHDKADLQRKLQEKQELTLVCRPNSTNVTKYTAMLPKYQHAEDVKLLEL